MGLVGGPGSEALKPPWLWVDTRTEGALGKLQSGRLLGVFNSSQLCFLCL